MLVAVVCGHAELEDKHVATILREPTESGSTWCLVADGQARSVLPSWDAVVDELARREIFPELLLYHGIPL